MSGTVWQEVMYAMQKDINYVRYCMTGSNVCYAAGHQLCQVLYDRKKCTTCGRTSTMSGTVWQEVMYAMQQDINYVRYCMTGRNVRLRQDINYVRYCMTGSNVCYAAGHQLCQVLYDRK